MLLGPFAGGAGGYQLAGMTPAKRIEAALDQGSVFHPAEYRRVHSRWHVLCVEPHAVDHGLLRHLDRGKPRSALPELVRNR